MKTHCDRELTEGQTDELDDQMVFAKFPSTGLHGKREANPNAGYRRGAVTLLSLGFTFAKEALGSIVASDVDLCLKGTGLVLALGNMTVSCLRNVPWADGKYEHSTERNTNKGGNIPYEDRSWGEALSTKRMMLKLSLAAGGGALGFFVAGPLGAVKGADFATKAASAMAAVATANAVTHAGEVIVNATQQRPYLDFSGCTFAAKPDDKNKPLIDPVAQAEQQRQFGNVL